MGSLLQVLKVLTEPTRLRLLSLLLEEELTVAELQEILGMGQSRISANLALLHREALVAQRRVGKNVFYSAVHGRLEPLNFLLRRVVEDLPDINRDKNALLLALQKRKDRATEYFSKLAGKFDRAYIPGRSWQALAHALLRILPPGVIADLGAGEGTLSQLLARTAQRVIAVDNSAAMVKFGSSLARSHGCQNLEYRLGDIENLPIKDGEVDLALFSQALHHTSSPQRALYEAARILRPGGRVLILDLVSHTYEQARELYAHVWLGFSEIELHQFLERAAFIKTEISVVSRERQAPHFQTIIATALKPE
ncbi:putative methyltransferase YcgJ [Candidatus Xiphinematobacter sp. Idaho Grape]|uniref:metalloregulator ArsR/SmtB family transcription factor n=1 Tax=Candidatus Xiphinematobacter sp. Idaho Grape TaxID=1704307 RepID=UPI000706718A|nr:metalloregulator ArsR/SmtB family transcription factor [Candidatus Xiphinematobacter sp. Idaho Grape]ALJ56376.1 putative methyltransferase YcgJ [Candidatus Xiphinematobacter sp. Idaho Grape]